MSRIIGNDLIELEKKVRSYVPDPKYHHDEYILITLREAIAAAKQGNYGVGAVLLGGDNRIICKGHNHIFNPYFRSDLHAEMVVLSKFEKLHRNFIHSKKLRLFSSLEPCPMCFARLIISGVKEIYYAAIDEYGGMVHRSKYLPRAWRELSKRQKFSMAKCSPLLRDMALKVFLSNVYENDDRLLSR